MSRVRGASAQIISDAGESGGSGGELAYGHLIETTTLPLLFSKEEPDQSVGYNGCTQIYASLLIFELSHMISLLFNVCCRLAESRCICCAALFFQPDMIHTRPFPFTFHPLIPILFMATMCLRLYWRCSAAVLLLPVLCCCCPAAVVVSLLCCFTYFKAIAFSGVICVCEGVG